MPRLADALRTFSAGEALVEVYETSAASGAAAADRAAEIINIAVARNGHARVIGATGNSQIPFVDALVKLPVRWDSVELFHMDEYVGLSGDHPASFRRWIRERFEERARPQKVHYLNGEVPDLDAEVSRYAQLLNSSPIDVAFVGIGENGHIAFNDPPVADFNDPATVKVVTLDEACRRQQAGEGHFPDIQSVPKQAVSITCPGLFRAQHWVCMVPDGRKSEAVFDALEGPIAESCPASLVRRHPHTFVFLDSASASRLTVS